MVGWDTPADWDAGQSESAIVHESVTNTDHDDAGSLKQGYSYESPPDSGNILVYHPLQEASGATGYDIVNGNDGTYDSVSLGNTGLLGTAGAVFDGSASDMVFTAPAATAEKTVLVWVYPTFDPADSTWYHAYCSDEDGSYGLQRLRVTENEVGFSVGDGSGEQSATVDKTNLTQNAWNLLGGRYVENDSVWFDLWNGGGTHYSASTSLGSVGPVSDTQHVGQRSGDARVWQGRLSHHVQWSVRKSDSFLQHWHDTVRDAGDYTTSVKSL